MKTYNFYRAIIPLLLAFLNVSNSAAFSFNNGRFDLDPRNYDYLQEDQNSEAYLLQELTTGGCFQVVTKNDHAPGVDLISGNSGLPGNFSEETNLTYIFTRDKKDSLKIYIFPFHFFW